jgi:hypothetical protein
MRLSRGWCGLVLFWTAVVTFGTTTAWTLQSLGPPGPPEAAAPQRQADPAGVEFARQVPATFQTAAAAAQTTTRQDPADPPAAVAPETIASAGEHGLRRFAAIEPDDQKEPPIAERTLHLRIVRDSAHCPRTACYRWHVLERRIRSPHPATLDLASLRLAPSIREAAEKGQVELIIDAVEHHRTIRGRDSIVFVATSLAGVTPHDGP